MHTLRITTADGKVTDQKLKDEQAAHLKAAKINDARDGTTAFVMPAI